MMQIKKLILVLTFVALQGLPAQETTVPKCEHGIFTRLANLFSLNEKKARILNNKGVELYGRNDWEAAMQQYRQALGLIHQDRCLNLTGTIYHNMALVYDDEDRYEEAIAYQKKAVEVKLATLSENSSSLAGSYKYLAATYRTTAEYKEAERYYKKALDIYKGKKDDSAKMADVYTGLGENARLSGDLARSFKWNKMAVKILEKQAEEEVLLSTAYNNLGLSYYDDGNYSESIVYYFKSTAMKDEGTIEVAKTYNNIASSYDALEDFDKAIEYYQKALKIFEKILGKDALYTVLTFNNIGVCYENKGDFKVSLGYLEKAYTGAEKILGKTHPHVKTLKENRDRVKRELLHKEQ